MTDYTTRGTIVPLTEAELSALNKMLASGDRAGFYLTYYSMTGSQEALLQAKIATFSGEVGGEAFVVNELLQYAYGEDGTEVSGSYPGLYYLSQKVARSAYSAIFDAASHGTGVIDDATFFSSAQLAWASAPDNAGRLFPGNILSGNYNDTNSPGGYYSAEALAYASNFGKVATDYSPSDIVTIAGGASVAIDSDGKIVAVFAYTPKDDAGCLANLRDRSAAPS